MEAWLLPGSMPRPPVRHLLRLLIVSFVTVCAYGALSESAIAAPAAGGGPTISTQPALFPAFDPAVTDYVTRCAAGTPVQVAVRSPSQTKVSVDGRAARGGNFTTSVALSEGQDFTITVLSGKRAATTHLVRCLPADFPTFTAERSGATQAEWYIVAPWFSMRFGPPPDGTSDKYVAAFDNNGVPVWWYRADTQAVDAKLLPNGNMAWLRYDPTESNLGAEEHRLDGSTVRILDTVGSGADTHEIQLLPNGNYLLARYYNRPGVDLRSCGGPADGTVIDNEVQELAPDGSLVWSWKAMDHIPISELSPSWTDFCAGSGPADLYHFNSAELDGDGLLLSFRHLDAVYRVRKDGGGVAWKLGGTPRPESLTAVGDPQLADGAGFGGQHDARVLGDGTVSIYDNGTRRARAPRAVRYRIDPAARTATLVEQVGDPDAPDSLCCGSSRKLAGGNWVAAWGRQPFVTELTTSGSRVFRLNFTQSLFTYRADAVPFGVLSRAALRSGMDARYPR